MDKKEFKTQYIKGFRAGIPVILGFVPVAIAFAVMARQAGLTLMQTCGMSVFVFAGASQMLGAGMYAQGAGLLAIVVATFVLNLRHIIMSTVVMKRMTDGRKWARIAAAFGVTDESFAIFSTEKEENCTLAFFVGLITSTYCSWVAGTFVGALASDFLPAVLTASLAISLYAMFIGLLVPNLRGNSRLVALVALTALCNTLLSQIIAPSWALIASTLICAFIGSFFVDTDQNKEVNANE